VAKAASANPMLIIIWEQFPTKMQISGVGGSHSEWKEGSVPEFSFCKTNTYKKKNYISLKLFSLSNPHLSIIW
jgi:hypothetical protein